MSSFSVVTPGGAGNAADPVPTDQVWNGSARIMVVPDMLELQRRSHDSKAKMFRDVPDEAKYTIDSGYAIVGTRDRVAGNGGQRLVVQHLNGVALPDGVANIDEAADLIEEHYDFEGFPLQTTRDARGRLNARQGFTIGRDGVMTVHSQFNTYPGQRLVISVPREDELSRARVLATANGQRKACFFLRPVEASTEGRRFARLCRAATTDPRTFVSTIGKNSKTTRSWINAARSLRAYVDANTALALFHLAASGVITVNDPAAAVKPADALPGGAPTREVQCTRIEALLGAMGAIPEKPAAGAVNPEAQQAYARMRTASLATEANAQLLYGANVPNHTIVAAGSTAASRSITALQLSAVERLAAALHTNTQSLSRRTAGTVVRGGTENGSMEVRLAPAGF